MYGNEREVGEGIRSVGPRPRRGLRDQQAEQLVPRARRRAPRLRGTLEALGFDHVDLFLIHWPLPTLYDGDFVSTWKTMEEFKADGRARSIGVSNFQVEHLERLATETDTVPAVNQIELHPYFQNREVRAHDEEQGIATARSAGPSVAIPCSSSWARTSRFWKYGCSSIWLTAGTVSVSVGEPLQMLHLEVRDADRARAPVGLELLERAPG